LQWLLRLCAGWSDWLLPLLVLLLLLLLLRCRLTRAHLALRTLLLLLLLLLLLQGLGLCHRSSCSWWGLLRGRTHLLLLLLLLLLPCHKRTSLTLRTQLLTLLLLLRGPCLLRPCGGTLQGVHGGCGCGLLAAGLRRANRLNGLQRLGGGH